MLLKPYPKTIIALVLSLGAIAAPAANAMLPPADSPCLSCRYSAVSAHSSPANPPVLPNPDEQTASRVTSSGQQGTPAAIVRVEANHGFDWGDAGIGAAGAVAVALVALGLTLVVRASRPAPAGRRMWKSRARDI